MTPILRTKFNLGLFFNAFLLLTILLPSKAFALDPQLLNVTVTDGISNTPLANQAIGILRREADGNLKGIRTLNTDANGQL
ncbi:hypothetical protein, partial [Methylomonas lenta]|uniref:hypothetical protein n=1 Tax=Methylomonas lenta TaxID=980561 RepID=UPI000B171D28